MNYKHPEIFYFLLLLIVPILVHFFRFRRFKTQYFTNVLFLKELQILNRKSHLIKKMVLLLIRLLFITCLIFAFAQPYFKTEKISEIKDEWIIILDNSYSMQTKGKDGELLKTAIVELVAKIPENLNFSLLTNDQDYWNTDIKSIQDELKKIEYSASPFQLNSIINRIKSQPHLSKKQIILITDATDLDSKQLDSLEKIGDLHLVIPKSEENNNTKIDEVAIQKTDEQFYEIGVKVSYFGKETTPISMAIYNENKLIGKTIVNRNVKNNVVLLSIPKKSFNGYVTIKDNDLEFDNTLYFTISEIKKTNCMSIGKSEKSEFLSRIYTSDEFNYTNFDLTQLNYNQIDKQEAIILNELDEIPLSLQTNLYYFVNKGGKLIVIPSGKTNLVNTNAFLSKFGNIQLTSLSNSEKLITKINFNHPLFDKVFRNKVSNFQYPKTKTSFKLSSNTPSPLLYEDNYPFLSSTNSGQGNLTVFSAPLNIENSNIQQSDLIVPVFYKLIQSTSNNVLNYHTIGDSTPYSVNEIVPKDAVLTIKNKDEQFIPLQKISNHKVTMTFLDYPKKAGNFAVYNGQKWIQNISFNYDRKESSIKHLDTDIFSKYEPIDTLDNLIDGTQSKTSESKIWKWFAIFALFLLILETIIIRFVK